MKHLKLEPIAVANYIVTYAQANDSPISNLKLQKVLYLVQAAFLVEQQTELMSVTFSWWQYGPTVKDVYYNFRDRGALPITEPAQVLDDQDFTYYTPELTNVPESVLKVLDNYLDIVLCYKTAYLIRLTESRTVWAEYFANMVSKHPRTNLADALREYPDSTDYKVWLLTGEPERERDREQDKLTTYIDKRSTTTPGFALLVEQERTNPEQSDK